MTILALLESRRNVIVSESVADKVRGGVGAVKKAATMFGRRADYKLSSAKGKAAMDEDTNKRSAGRGLLKAAGVAYVGYKGAKLAAKGVKKLYNKVRGRESSSLVSEAGGLAKKIKHYSGRAAAALTGDSYKSTALRGAIHGAVNNMATHDVMNSLSGRRGGYGGAALVGALSGGVHKVIGRKIGSHLLRAVVTDPKKYAKIKSIARGVGRGLDVLSTANSLGMAHLFRSARK